MYASVADLRLRLSDLFTDIYTDRNGVQMDWEAEQDLQSASAEIDGFVGLRYKIPVTAPAALPVLKSWCLILAEELAWSRAGRPDLPKNVRERVDRIRELLVKVSSGDIILPGAPETDTGGAGASVIVEAEEPVFTRTKLGRFGGV